MEGLLAGSGILTIIVFVVAVLAFLMPFFVLKIRNQVVSINQKMDTIIELLGGESGEVFPSGVKFCTDCGAKNRMEDGRCINCSKPI